MRIPENGKPRRWNGRGFLETMKGFILRTHHINFNADLSNMPGEEFPCGLTRGGREVWRIAKRPVATCNLLASFAGIGAEVSK